MKSGGQANGSTELLCTPKYFLQYLLERFTPPVKARNSLLFAWSRSEEKSSSLKSAMVLASRLLLFGALDL